MDTQGKTYQAIFLACFLQILLTGKEAVYVRMTEAAAVNYFGLQGS
ncbi:MAG: hypothetical protein ACOCSE_00145 [Chitinivibrionales bacterium]